MNPLPEHRPTAFVTSNYLEAETNDVTCHCRNSRIKPLIKKLEIKMKSSICWRIEFRVDFYQKSDIFFSANSQAELPLEKNGAYDSLNEEYLKSQISPYAQWIFDDAKGKNKFYILGDANPDDFTVKITILKTQKVEIGYKINVK